MIFAPVRLGETSLNAEAVAADKKSCKRFGPCGVGKEALFLNSYFIDRRYYVAFSSVRRVFKRVAMSQGGFSGQGVFGAMLLREDAGGYVLVGVVSFAAAAAFTALCFRLRNRENQKKGGADKPNRHEQEEKSQ